MSRYERVVRAFVFVFRSFSFVRRHRLARYFILPGLLGLLLGSAIGVGVFSLSMFLLEKVALALIGHDAFLKPFLWLFAFGQAILFFGLSWRFVAALAVLPSLGPLQDRLEVIATGSYRQTRWIDDAKNAALGGLNSLIQMGGFAVLSVLTLPLGPFGGFLLTIYDAYFLGSGIYDALLERDFPSPSVRRRELRKMRPEMLGVGLGAFVLLFIPVLGIFTSSGMGLVAAFRLRNMKKNEKQDG